MTAKLRLVLLNLSLALFFAGTLISLNDNFGVGAIFTLVAGALAATAYGSQLRVALKNNTSRVVNAIVLTVGALAMAMVFLVGFSFSIRHSLLLDPGFLQVYHITGFLILAVFVWSAFQSIEQLEHQGQKILLVVSLAVFCIMSFIGFLGFAGLEPHNVMLIYRGFVLFVFVFFGVGIVFTFKKTEAGGDRFGMGILVVSVLLILYWIIRWQATNLLTSNVSKVFVYVGFLIVIGLPVSIAIVARKHYFIIYFILYSVVVDFYLIPFNREYRYLAEVGLQECVGYDDAINYRPVFSVGVSDQELFAKPQPAEIEAVANEWRSKSFSPKRVKIEFEERLPNGDSLKVISHWVGDSLRHFGLMRIPKGIDASKAPLLLMLQGGGPDLDVLTETFADQILPQRCANVIGNYILLMPSFRGEIVRGNGFCYRSAGYNGDVWIGPAEDAISFLEAAKSVVHQEDSSRVIAVGISRGATTGLIIKALTEKVDYCIAISPHTTFLDQNVYEHERVGADFPKIFFTPETTVENVRKRLIAASPYLFSDRLSGIEIHSGTEDKLTSPYHVSLLKDRMTELGKLGETVTIHTYPGKGHGFFDDRIVCQTLTEFFAKGTP